MAERNEHFDAEINRLVKDFWLLRFRGGNQYQVIELALVETCLVYADWLEEFGNEAARGWRWLAALKTVAREYEKNWHLNLSGMSNIFTFGPMSTKTHRAADAYSLAAKLLADYLSMLETWDQTVLQLWFGDELRPCLSDAGTLDDYMLRTGRPISYDNKALLLMMTVVDWFEVQGQQDRAEAWRHIIRMPRFPWPEVEGWAFLSDGRGAPSWYAHLDANLFHGYLAELAPETSSPTAFEAIDTLATALMKQASQT